jgi:DNA modification methylase
MRQPQPEKNQSRQKDAPKHRGEINHPLSELAVGEPVSLSKPKPLPYSDLDVSQWREYGHIEKDSLWIFNGRDRQNGHQNDYHGNCVPQILTQLLTRFTKQDDTILDLFLGSGTSAIEAVNLSRKAVGVELNPTMVAYVREKLESQGKADQVEIINGDSANAEPWQAGIGSIPFSTPPIRRYYPFFRVRAGSFQCHLYRSFSGSV